MNGKLKKNIGFSMIPIAFLFLFEPNFTIIDLLPDFIGYIILSSALINLADINQRIAEALSGFRKGIIISLMRFVAIYLLKSYFIDAELSIGILLFVFVFSFFEIIVLIPAYKSLFEGLLSLGIHYDGTVVYYKRIRKKLVTDHETGEKKFIIKEGSRNLTEKTFFVTAAFLIVKGLSATLPEFTAIINNTEYEFVGILRTFGIMLTLPLGLAWLICIISYFIRVCKDRPFVHSLSRLYIETAREKINCFTVRKITMGIYTLIIAFLFSTDFYSNHINLIPNGVFYLVLIIAAIMLHRFSKKWKLTTAVSFLGLISSSLVQYSSIRLYSDPDFYPAAIQKDLNAYYAYYRMVSFNILDAIIFFITVLLVLFMLWDIYKIHSDIAISDSKKEYIEHKNHFLKGAIPVLSLAFVSAAGTIYFVLSQPFENIDNWLLYYSSIIAIVLSIVFTIFAVYFVGFINNSIKFRYRLDI